MALPRVERVVVNADATAAGLQEDGDHWALRFLSAQVARRSASSSGQSTAPPAHWNRGRGTPAGVPLLS